MTLSLTKSLAMVDGDEISAKPEKKERIEMSKDVSSLNDDTKEDKRE